MDLIISFYPLVDVVPAALEHESLRKENEDNMTINKREKFFFMLYFNRGHSVRGLVCLLNRSLLPLTCIKDCFKKSGFITRFQFADEI